LDHVKVHRNSDKPAQLQSHAYAQGSEIHLAPGQEEHLPHEAWHVVQQMQGRVKPTVSTSGVQINDDARLEQEADRMGGNALHHRTVKSPGLEVSQSTNAPIQKVTQLLRFDAGVGSGWHIHFDHIKLGKRNESRVEFNGRSKKEIRKELGEKIDRFGLDVGQPGFRDCIDYINTHC
jgi:hypothetical protein